MAAKRYLKFCMSVPYKRYIATTSDDNPKPSTSVGEWENSHNFYPESFNNCLHYTLVSLNLFSFGIGYECPKSPIFGVKRGGVCFFCRQDRTPQGKAGPLTGLSDPCIQSVLLDPAFYTMANRYRL